MHQQYPVSFRFLEDAEGNRKLQYCVDTPWPRQMPTSPSFFNHTPFRGWGNPAGFPGRADQGMSHLPPDYQKPWHQTASDFNGWVDVPATEEIPVVKETPPPHVAEGEKPTPKKGEAWYVRDARHASSSVWPARVVSDVTGVAVLEFMAIGNTMSHIKILDTSSTVFVEQVDPTHFSEI